MDGWDIALWVVAGYVAVTALTRMMLTARRAAADKLRREIAAEQSKRPIAKPAAAKSDKAA